MAVLDPPASQSAVEAGEGEEGEGFPLNFFLTELKKKVQTWRQ